MGKGRIPQMERTVAHYNLLDRMGEGGLGEVYRARDTRAGRTVALKLLPVAADAAARQALLEDARAAATLSHPNIATLWDVGTDAGTDYLAYEYVAGISLRQEIGGRPIHPRRAVELAVQMADALAEAHAAGVIHGDLRPDTICVTQKGSAKLLDFGMARWTRGGAVRARAATRPDSLEPATLPIVGYLSPEQALGGLVDGRTDVFSLSVVLYEMLTGQHPFAGATPDAMIVEIIRTAPVPPSALNSAIPAELDALVLRGLSKDIQNRPQSAAAFSAELRSVGAVLDVRSGDPGASGLMPLDDEPEPGAGKWVAAGVALVAIAGAVWYFLR